MRQFLLIGQQVLGYLMMAAIAAFVYGWVMLAVGWAEDWVDEGWTLLNVGGRNWIDLGDRSVTWGELRSKTVTDALGRNGLEFEFVTLQDIPNWSILLGMSVIAFCLLFITPRRMLHNRFVTDGADAAIAQTPSGIAGYRND